MNQTGDAEGEKTTDVDDLERISKLRNEGRITRSEFEMLREPYLPAELELSFAGFVQKGSLVLGGGERRRNGRLSATTYSEINEYRMTQQEAVKSLKLEFVVILLSPAKKTEDVEVRVRITSPTSRRTIWPPADQENKLDVGPDRRESVYEIGIAFTGMYTGLWWAETIVNGDTLRKKPLTINAPSERPRIA